MTDLPAPLAEPLHILEPGPWRTVLIALVLTLLAAWLFWLWVRRRLATRGQATEAPELPELDAFAEAVESLRRQTHESRCFRHGCHELAQLLRHRLELRHGAGLAYLTARETAARWERDGGAQLLVEASSARFARRPPNLTIFDSLCDRVLALNDGRGR